MESLDQSSVSAPERFCPGCGYDLRGIASERCPECGLGTDQAVWATSMIPWVHRRRIGRARAYFKTMLLVMRRPRTLAAEAARPVALADALMFRRVTTLLAAAPCAAAAIFVAFYSDALVGVFRQPGEFAAELFVLPVILAAIWFFFFTITGVQSYWFHPSSIPIVQQNRAIAISYYASAPIALTPIALFLAGVVSQTEPWVERYRSLWFLPPAVGLAAVLLVLAWVVLTLRSCLVSLRRSTHCGAARTIGMVIGLPIAWGMLAVIFLAAIPGACIFLALVMLS